MFSLLAVATVGGVLAAATPLEPGVDRYGDPLPPGARLRLGTLRARQKQPISRILYAPNGKTIVTGSETGEIEVRDAVSARPLRRLDPAMDVVRDIAMSGDGKAFAAVGFAYDPERRLSFYVLTVLDLATGRHLSRTEWTDDRDVWCLAFSRDGTRLATGSDNGALRLWNAANGEEIVKLQLGEADVHAVAFSRDGSAVAASSRDASGGNVRIHVIDVEERRGIKALTGHKRTVRTLAYSPFGNVLASGAEDPNVILWDVAAGRVLRRLDSGSDAHAALAFSPDGTLLAGSDFNGVVNVWDAATGRVRRRIESARHWHGPIAFAPDGQTLASSTGPVLHLWDLETGRDRLNTTEAHELPITRLLCTEGGKTLVSASDDGTVRVWDLATGRQRMVLEHKGFVRSIALSPDGKLLATAAERPDGHVRIWDLGTGKDVRLWSGREQRGYGAVALTFAADGRSLFTFWRNGSVRRFEVLTGDELPATQPGFPEPREVMGQSGFFVGMFSPGGALVAASGMGTGLTVSDLARGATQFEVPAGRSSFVFSFAGHGSTLAVARTSSVTIRMADGRLRSQKGEGAIRLVDTRTGKERLEITRPECQFTCLAFSPDGQILAAAEVSGKNAIHLYRTADGHELGTFRGHDSAVTSLEFTPDGQTLASGLQGTTVLLWDVPINR